MQEIKDKAKSINKDDRLTALSEIAVHKLKNLLDVAVDAMLNDPLPEVRENAAWTVDNLNDERALPALINALYDDAFGVRSNAGWGLVHLGNIVVPYMQEIIEKDDSPGAKQMANMVLEHL
jgi:HEAT repeat protein